MASAYSIFCETFGHPSEKVALTESVLDYPNEKGLDRRIWILNKDGSWKLKDGISKEIAKISAFITKKLKLGDTTAVIIGSICTNSYSKDSDIDVHIEVRGFGRKSEKFMRELNKTARDEFKKRFGDVKFGSHPVEIYIQNNRLQDIGSRGAYDIADGKWISEPQIVDADFDPYEEYYEKAVDSMEKDGLISRASKIVFDAGMVANAMVSVRKNGKFLKRLSSRLLAVSKTAKSAFDEMRKSRKMSSLPKSVRDARKMRTDSEWNTRDAAFKMMDEIGILKVLKDISNVASTKGSPMEKAAFVLDTIQENLFSKE